MFGNSCLPCFHQSLFAYYPVFPSYPAGGLDVHQRQFLIGYLGSMSVQRKFQPPFSTKNITFTAEVEERTIKAYFYPRN